MCVASYLMQDFRSSRISGLLMVLLSLHLMPGSHAADLFVEAESFEDHGGWKLDTQFIQSMGSPYLLAHGLGVKVADAKTRIQVAETGTYRLWVRTYDWVARWNASPSPGKFRVSLDGKTLPIMFGTEGKTWGWQDGGKVSLQAGETELRLIDERGSTGDVIASI